jgi:accessory Sec system glycosyltransferase GtfB
VLALFDRYDESTQELMRSLETAEIAVTPVVIQYDGELPIGALCPFVTYTGLERDGRPLFFNEVPVPAWCEIRQGREPYGTILRDGYVIARINYEPNSFREVASVDWLQTDRTPSHTDHYDRYGNRYATTYYSNGLAHQTVYSGPARCHIEVDHVTRLVTMRTPQRLLTFPSLADFVSSFLDEQRLATDRVLINSLSHPLFVMRKRAHAAPGRAPATTLFWQEPMPGEAPGNMTSELERPVALERIVFVDERLRAKVTAAHPGTSVELAYLSHLGQFSPKADYDPKRAFTLTNSDEIPALVPLLEAFPEVTFSVAAPTLMSEKLHDLGRRHPNLTLIPSITHSRIHQELDRASVYLDINAGTHVLDVAKAAYYLGLVVLAPAEQAKAPDHARVVAGVEELKAQLATVVGSPEGRARVLQELHTQRGPLSEAADYHRLFG